MALAARKTPVGWRRRTMSVAISAVCRTAASSASLASGWVRISRRPRPNSPRVISSGGCSGGQAGTGARGGAGSLVVVPNVRPSWWLTGSVPAPPQAGHETHGIVAGSGGYARMRLRPEDEVGEPEFVLRDVPPTAGRGVAWPHAVLGW